MNAKAAHLNKLCKTQFNSEMLSHTFSPNTASQQMRKFLASQNISLVFFLPRKFKWKCKTMLGSEWVLHHISGRRTESEWERCFEWGKGKRWRCDWSDLWRFNRKKLFFSDFNMQVKQGFFLLLDKKLCLIQHSQRQTFIYCHAEWKSIKPEWYKKKWKWNR